MAKYHFDDYTHHHFGNHSCIVKIALFLFLIYASPLVGADAPSTAQISETLHRETIPNLKLTAVTFDEALATVRRSWEHNHPKEPFLVGLTDFSQPKGFYETNAAQITLDIKNIPYIDALRFIGTLGGRRLIEYRGTVQLEKITWIVEDWMTNEYSVTPKTLAALGLNNNSSKEDVRNALKKLGVEFEDWMNACLANNARSIVVTNREMQQHQISGIIMLLEKGFKITK